MDVTESQEDEDQEASVDTPDRMPYQEFLKERARMIDARQRVQQRTDQLITAGAAGALVLSITFLEKIAPSPDPSTRWFLFGSWISLLVALGLNLGAHYLAPYAFDAAIKAFDESFVNGKPYELGSRAQKVSERMGRLGAICFAVGVALLALFSSLNVNFTGG